MKRLFEQKSSIGSLGATVAVHQRHANARRWLVQHVMVLRRRLDKEIVRGFEIVCSLVIAMVFDRTLQI
jgi:hypothetical protein